MRNVQLGLFSIPQAAALLSRSYIRYNNTSHTLHSHVTYVTLKRYIRYTHYVTLIIRYIRYTLLVPQAAALMLADRALIHSQGPLVGFTPLVWMVVLLKAFGGLLVAAVVKCAAPRRHFPPSSANCWSRPTLPPARTLHSTRPSLASGTPCIAPRSAGDPLPTVTCHAYCRYADNVLKTYATAIAIVLTCIITTVTTHVSPSVGFLQVRRLLSV